MSKVGKKVLFTVLIIIGTIILYLFLVMTTVEPGKRIAPSWTGFSILAGVYAIIHIWSTGWSSKKKNIGQKPSAENIQESLPLIQRIDETENRTLENGYFLFSERINIYAFKEKLGQLKFEEDENPPAKTVTFYYDLKWNEIPGFLEGMKVENPVKLTSYFDYVSGLIKAQRLSFNSFSTAKTMFFLTIKNALAEENPDWKVNYWDEHDFGGSAESKDGRFKVHVIEHKGRFSFEKKGSATLFLTYLELESH